jgi:cyanophycinase
VITTATEHPGKRVGEEYRTVLMGLGAAEVNVVSVVDRQAAKQAPGRRVRKCTGIFFTGGDQLR